MNLSSENIRSRVFSKISGRQPWPVMNSLISLDLDFNEIGDNLEAGKFRGLNTLQALHLRGNGITKPPKEALADLRSVRVISLDYNNLTKLGRHLREFVLSINSR